MTVDNLSEVERDFDLDTLRKHASARIDRATVETEPYAHCVIDDLLPEKFYEAFVASIPSQDRFGNNNAGLPREEQHTFVLNQPDYCSISPLHDKVYRRLMALNRFISTKILEKFAPFIEQAFEEIFGSDAAAYVADIESEHVPVPAFYERNEKYRVGAHTDGHFRLASWIHYLPVGSGGGSRGLELYRVVDRSPDFDPIEAMFLRDTTNQEVALDRTIDCRPNRAVAFVNSPRSFHAVAQIDAAEKAMIGRRITTLNWIEIRKDSAERIYGDALFRRHRPHRVTSGRGFIAERTIDPAGIGFAPETPHDEELRVTTRPAQWSYAAWSPIERLGAEPANVIRAEVSVESGTLGVGIQYVGDERFTEEHAVEAGKASAVTMNLPQDKRPIRIVFRNHADNDRPTRFRIGPLTLGRHA